MALNVASLRRCVSQKILALRHSQTEWRGHKKKVSRNGATTQRKKNQFLSLSAWGCRPTTIDTGLSVVPGWSAGTQMDGGASRRPRHLDTGNPGMTASQPTSQRRTGFVIPSETFCIFPDAVALYKTLAARLQTPPRFVYVGNQ